MAVNTPQLNASITTTKPTDPAVIAAISPAFHRPTQPLPRQASQQQQNQFPASPYTRASQQQQQQQQPSHISSPIPSADPKRLVPRPRSGTTNDPPSMVQPSQQPVPHSQQQQQQLPSQPQLPQLPQQQQQQQPQQFQAPKKLQQPIPQQSPQTLKPLSSPQQPTLPPQPQQSNGGAGAAGGGGGGGNGGGSNSIHGAIGVLAKTTSSELPPRTQLSPSPRPPTRPVNIPGSGSGQGLRHGPGMSPGQDPARASSPLASPLSPSSPRSPLPPPVASAASPSIPVTFSPATTAAPAPKPRPAPPTLPPARAHGIHARPLARPPSTLTTTTPATVSGSSSSSISTSSPSLPLFDTAPRPKVGQASGAVANPGTPSPRPRDSLFPALQAPQQSHQPRQQRQSGLSSVRPPTDAAGQPRPPLLSSGQLSSKSLLATTVDTQIPQPVTALPEVYKKTTAERQENTDHIGQDVYPEGGEDDDDADEDESTPGKGHDRSKKSRQRKVRKSLEKLTRLSIDKKRRSRQIKSLTSIAPTVSTSTVESTAKVDSIAQTPKRQSLWASLFGNGKTESRPAIADSLVRNNGSTQSLGPLTTPSQHSQQPSTSSTASSPVSPRSEKSLSDMSSNILGSEAASSQQSPAQSEVSQDDSRADSATPVDDISAVNVVRHDRSRTLPGILPQWESGIFWTLSRALNNKRTEAPPLDSDSSADESDDGSLETTDIPPESESRASIASREIVTEDSASTNEESEFVDAESNAPETEAAQRSPSLPAPAALSIKAQVPRERIVVAEAQVQIGDDLEEEDPFTDSHALSATSPSVTSSTSSRSHPSALGGTPKSSPSPSLSPLSYLTGAAASGSTWSLQGSRQSLMKMIFKSRNDTTSSTATETGSPADVMPDWPQPKSDGLLGSSSPLTPIRADLFSDFESNGEISLSTDGQSKDMKRRSFVLPGAFPGEERASQDEPRVSESGYVQEHVPMYAASEGDSLAVVQQDDPNLYNVQDDRESSDSDDDKKDETSSSDEEEEIISTHPSKASYDRTSFLQGPPLPQFNPAASTSPRRHQRTRSQILTSPVFSGVKNSGMNEHREPLQIQVHPAGVVASRNAVRLSPRPVLESFSKPQVPPRKLSEPAEPPKLDKASPSALGISKPQPGSGGPFADRMSIVSPVTSPLNAKPVTQSTVDARVQESDTLMNSTSDSGAIASGNAIDYSRYKEEVSPETEQSMSAWGRLLSEKAPREDSSDTSYDESTASRNSSGGSPLVVEVISSGLRSTVPERPASPRTKAVHMAMSQPSIPPTHTVPMHSQPSQSRTNNPPPIPPPRNARRPRSKQMSRYASRESMGDAFENIAITSIAPEPITTTRSVITPVTTDSPSKEHIMEEMGSEQARNFNEEDYLYCQSDRMRHDGRTSGRVSQRSQGSRDQVYGQPYGEGNSAFDGDSDYPDYQQQQSLANWHSGQQQQQQHQVRGSGTSNSSGDALLVATLRDQIASLSSERDQFYQEALLLRQKHDMLTNLVNNMGVAVESIQQQQFMQQQQQQQQQQQHLYMSHQVQMEESAALQMNSYSQQGGHDYGVQDQPRRHHEDQAKQYVEQVGRTVDTQGSQYDFGQSSSHQHEVDPYPVPAQQEEPQLQPRRNHFHDTDIQRTERVRQLSDEYLIQMPRNSEESVRGYYPHQQDSAQDLAQSQVHGFQSFGQPHGPNQTTYGGDSYQTGYDDRHIQEDPLNQYQQQNPHLQQQQQQLQQQQAPVSFGEGYDLIPSHVGQEPAPVMTDDLQSGDYYHQQQHVKEDQRHSGLTLHQLKQQHQQNKLHGHQYRHSTDTRHSSQSSQDGYQLVDIITTRPMSGGFEFRYGGGGQQAQAQDQFGPTNPFSSNYAGGRPLSMKTPAQDLSSLRPHQGHVDQEFSSGPHLRRHHSMQHPQGAGRPFGGSDIGLSHASQQPYAPHHNSQSNAHRSHQPRPPAWAPQHLKRSSSSSIMHQRQPSNSLQNGFPSQSEAGLLLLSSSTSFLEDLHGDTPLLSSAVLGDSSLLSNVVQREKVRIEEKTSSKHGAAGWSERAFSPVISNAGETQGLSSASNAMPSFASAITESIASVPAQPTKPRVVTQDEANKIREQFEEYRANPKRRSGLLNVDQDTKDRLRVTEDESSQQKKWNESFADATSDSDTDSDTEDDDQAEKGQTGENDRDDGVGADEGRFGVGASLLGRSKTIASTGISSGGGTRGQLDPSASSTSSTDNPSSTIQPVKESLQRHHSSSGSLRTVPRHTQNNQQPRAEEMRGSHFEGPSVVGRGQSESVLVSGRTGNGGAEGSSIAQSTSSSSQSTQEAPHRLNLPAPPATLPRPPIAAYKGTSANDGLSGHHSKITATSTSSTSSASRGLLSTSNKAVVDEEGGDWLVQAQPRRYNSGKLGMTGVTGVTRRAMGRPIERGHGIERGPEDCV
ncbi:hypothetical protein BGZ47_006451 [Haplosporangium gracile]|nr:hypothetical protein BGZ47_006451 [Haplosporangium gracile]